MIYRRGSDLDMGCAMFVLVIIGIVLISPVIWIIVEVVRWMS
jgi:uncharacterized protein (DUF983 family)